MYICIWIYALFFQLKAQNPLYCPMAAGQSLEESGTSPTPDGLNRPAKSSLRYQQSTSEYFIHFFGQPSGDKSGCVMTTKDLMTP